MSLVASYSPMTNAQTRVFDSMHREQSSSRGKLLYKLLVVFLVLSIGPVLLAGYELIRVGDKYMQEQILAVKENFALKVAGDVKGYVENVKNILQVVHKSSDFLTMNPNRQTVILSNLMNAYPM